MQIRFIGWKVWAVQAAYLLTVCGLLSHLLGQGYWKDPQSVAGLLVCLSASLAEEQDIILACAHLAANPLNKSRKFPDICRI